MKTRLLPFVPLFALAGCHNAAPGYVPKPVPPVPKVSVEVKDAAEMMPLEVGNQWDYAMHIDRTQGGRSLGSADQVVTYTVDSKSNDGAALLLVRQEGQVVDRQDWRATDQGMFQVTGGPKRISYTPPQPLVMLPATPDKTFKWSGRGVMTDGKVAHGEATSQILAPQTVDTKMGPLSAIPVVTKTTYEGGTSETTSWFRPGVGLVRFRQESVGSTGIHDTILLTLTSDSLKKS